MFGLKFKILLASFLLLSGWAIGHYDIVEAKVPDSLEEVLPCLPGSVEQWSNPIRADGSRIWNYKLTDGCEALDG